MAETNTLQDPLEQETVETEVSPEDSFEMRMLNRVKRDFQEATEFLDDIHRKCRENYAAYHNADTYEDLRKKNRFPMPTIQVLVDQFVAHLSDKLFYSNKPCTVVGVEDSDKPDADAKQDMVVWQDTQDNMFLKLETFVKDIGLYPFCVAQTDFIERIEKKWAIQEIPTALDAMGNILATEQKWIRTDIPVYRGPTTKRIDPTDFFFGPDKRDMRDEFPVMVRSMQTKSFFDTQPYFFNQDKIAETPAQPQESNLETEKRELVSLRPSAATGHKHHEYVEWQGPVDAVALYAFLLQLQSEKQEEYLNRLQQTEQGEMVWVVCGVVDGDVVVRLDTNPLDLDYSNITVGYAIPEENELIGGCLASNTMPVHKGQQVLMGILLENFKQSVNRQWIINVNALVNKKPLVNVAGNVLQTNKNINDVAKVIDQPAISQDIYKVIEYFTQLGKDTSMIQSQVQGKPEASVQTLGEASILQGQAELGLRKALKTFEVTFVEPLYTLRNEINCNFIDQDYAFYIIGESAVNWRTVTPNQIRASVDFVCESSTRESNKAVVGQQMLQLAELAPLAIQAGQMVRVDKIMQAIAESVFSMKKAQVYELFPLIQLEDMQKAQGGNGLNMQLAQMALMRQQFETAGAAPQPEQTGPGTPGPNLPEPSSEQEAQASIEGRNRPQ